MSFFDELKRRNVFRVGFAYAVVGWLVAQVADLALESFGAPDWVMKTLLFLLFIGFLAALFIAWAYEITPEGVKRAVDIDPDQSITQQTGRKLDRLVIVVLLISVGVLLFDRFQGGSTPVHQEPEVERKATPAASVSQAPGNTIPEADTQLASLTAPDQPSVAVLPFVNMSSDPEQEYFSDGISEEILNVLTRVPNLKVAARTSSFQFKGQNLDIGKIGKQLKVNHVLEGSVRKAGNTLRITAQLIETDTGFHMWSETFDRSPEDVFAIQDEIAAAIARQLRTLFSSDLDTGSTPIDMRAYELYLKGRSLVAKRQQATLLEGIEALQAAINIEPEYAPAMATVATAYVVLPWFSARIPAGEARRLARDWASRALEIDPDNVEAMSVLGIISMQMDLDTAEAIKLLEKAVKLNPGDVIANNFLGDIYTRIGDLDAALTYESRAAELDPLGPVQLTDLANVYYMLGDFEKVIALANRALDLDPSFQHAWQHLADANYCLGNTSEIARVYDAIKDLPDFMDDRVEAVKIQLMVSLGDKEGAANAVERRFERALAGEMPVVDVAFDAAFIGDFDSAGIMLMKAYENKDGNWLFPNWIRLPEQAPDSEPWQRFWSLPGVKELADLRRKNGMKPFSPKPAGKTES